jgi:DNA primase
VYLPVLIGGELKGYTRAALKKVKDIPSYINSSGGWTKDYGLFPYDYVAALRPRYVILVEGQRDALRLLQAGIPAIAIMGTQSWSDRKSRLIEMLGVDLAVLMMDGDDAGIQAIELIEPQIRKLVNTKIFNLAGKDSPYWRFRKEDSPSKAAKAAGVELWDPQNMPDHKLAELKSKIREWL